jgi:hypothetical protein
MQELDVYSVIDALWPSMQGKAFHALGRRLILSRQAFSVFYQSDCPRPVDAVDGQCFGGGSLSGEAEQVLRKFFNDMSRFMINQPGPGMR